MKDFVVMLVCTALVILALIVAEKISGTPGAMDHAQDPCVECVGR